MKEKTLSEKRRDLFSQRIKIYEDAIMKAENKETELWYNYLCVQLETIRRLVEEQDKQFIKEILDEANKYLKNHGEELEKWSEGNLDIESNQWIRAWIKDYVKIIKQKSGFEDLK